MAAITMRGITKRYADGTEAVKDVDLDIDDGEFVILVGPSGCGKSTLLPMIVGLEDISDGELRIGDQVVNDRAPKDRDIAMVFQNYALYPHMTVRENLGFALKLAKVPAGEIKTKVDEAAQTVPAALSQFPGASQFQQPTGSIAAAAIVVTVPIVIMVLFFQRRIVAGLTAGAVKG